MRDGWRELELGEIANIQQGKTLAVKNMTGGSAPVFGANGVIGHFDEGHYDHPVIAVGCRGSCGTIHVAPPGSFLANNVMAVWAKDCDLDQVFLRLALEHADMAAQGIITGQVQPQITKKTLSSLKLRVPTLVEQQRIADLLTHVDEVIGLGGVYAIELRRSLLSVLLSGEHEIPESYDRFLAEVA